MKIQKLEVEQFGGLKNFTLEFCDGAQYIYGENEAGKSTLCAFVAAMFYGLPPKVRSGGLRGDSRSLYMPWGENYMAGTLYFEAQGVEYVLKRRFGQTARSDKTSLLTARDWQEVSLSPEEIGQRFLGVGEEAFYKTLFISQLGAAFEKGKEDELMTRLSNLETTGEEDTSVQKALLELERAQHELVTKTGRGGAIVQLENDIEILKTELLEARQRHQSFRTLLEDIRRLTEEKNVAEKNLSDLTAQRETAAQFAEYQSYQEAVLKQEATTVKLAAEKKNLEIKLQELESLEKEKAEFSPVISLEPTVLSELAEKEAACGVLEKQLEELSSLCQEVAALSETISAEREKKRGRRPLFILMGLVVLLTIIFGIFISPLFFVAMLSLIVGMAFTIKNSNGKELVALEVQLAEKEAALLRMQEEGIAEKLSVLRAEVQTVFKIAQVDNLAELNQKIEKGKALLYRIREAEQESKRLSDAISQMETELINLPMPEAKPEVIYDGAAPAELDIAIRQLQTEQLDRERMLAQMHAKVESGFSGMRSIAEIESSIDEAQDHLLQLRESYKTISLAKEIMGACAEEMKNTFAPVLNKKSSELIRALTGGKYQEVRITDHYKIMLKTPTGTDIVPAEFVSAGTYDLLYFALRMAVLQTLYTEIPLMILDDTFIQLDEVRQREAFGWLCQNSNQVLYFSCHKPPEAWRGQVITL